MTPKTILHACAAAALLAAGARGQCGPNKDRPYPPGSSTCPTKDMADGMAPHDDNQPGDRQDGASTGTAACSAYPCAASLLGQVGATTVAGTTGTGLSLPVGEDIYGPFEAGFTATQDSILAGLGCAAGKGYVDPGLDVQLAEAIVAKDCGVQLPRNDGGDYISILDECGGHTREYHFHERLSCLYKEVDQAHSAKVGQGKDGKGIYGKWEKFASSNPTLPKLDACGGHFGATPDSGGKIVYHYHVQQNPPFTVGCFGPDKDAAGKETLVTLDKCRALYEGCSGTAKSYATGAGTKEYKQWCPCYDGQGSNVGSAELAVFASGSGAITTCTDSNCASSGVAASDIASSPSTGGGGSGAAAPSAATGAGGTTTRIHAAVAAAAAAALATVAGNAA